MSRKAQLEVMANWFIGLIVLFIMFIFFMIWIKPWQAIDNKISPQIDSSYEAGGKSAADIPQQVRRNQKIIPVILFVGVIVILILSSLRPDPNQPYQ